MAITPWEITHEFNRELLQQRGVSESNRARYDIANMGILAREQAASTAYERQLTRDELNYEQQLARDEASRRFSHEQGYLTNVTYKNMGRRAGRRGYVTGGTAPGAGSSAPTGAPVDGGAPTGGGGGGGLLTPQGAMQYYTSRGVPPAMAAGIVGNIDVESAWDPAVWSGKRRGDQGTAAFAGQWRGIRQQRLYEYARSRGHTQPTPEDQLDYFLEEAKMGHDAGARTAVSLAANAKSPEEAAAVWMENYERPSRDPKVNHIARRQRTARQVFEQFTAGGGGATAAPSTVETAAPGLATTQRRYGAGGGIPTPEELYAQEQGAAPEDAGVQLDVTQPMRPWTPQDFANEGLTNAEWSSVPEDMDVVDTQFFSGAQVGAMPESMQGRLLPVGGYDPEGTNQYLILQPKPTSPEYDVKGMEVDTEAGTGPMPIPTAGGQPMSTTGTVAPAPKLSTIPTGRRTRRNPDTGGLEFLVDGVWHESDQMAGG